MKTACIGLLTALCVSQQVSFAQVIDVPLSTLKSSKVVNASPAIVQFRGSSAFSMIPAKEMDPSTKNSGPLAILGDIQFHNGSIEVDLSGAPAKGADESARGFIGIVFRAQSASRFEIIYLRPTNSTADDQLRRNHTTQYSAEPDWPWDRLRTESPGVYESWVDMPTGNWTHVRIDVHGTGAELFVNNAKNPCLIVHDLKLGDSEGSVGLWMGRDTEGYFRNLRITRN
jgi:hypothetical protein